MKFERHTANISGPAGLLRHRAAGRKLPKRSLSFVAITLLVITALIGAVGLAAPASAFGASGVLTVSIVTPDGVPANVTVHSVGTSTLVSKPAAGSSTSQSLVLAA